MERCIGRDAAAHHVVSPAALRAGAGAAPQPQLAPVFALQQRQGQPPRRASPLPFADCQRPSADTADAADAAACADLDNDSDFEPSHESSRTRKKVRAVALGVRSG